MDILRNVAMKKVPPPEACGDGIPYVTHQGVLDIAGFSLRCYRLNDGRAIIDRDDFHAFFEATGLEPASEIPVEAISSAPPPNSAAGGR